MQNCRIKLIRKIGECPSIGNTKNLNGVLFSQNMNNPGSMATTAFKYSNKIRNTRKWKTIYDTNNLSNFEYRNIPRNSF